MSNWINDYSLIPDEMMEIIKRYINYGCEPGCFITAIFANDLFKAVGKCDHINMPIIPVYVSYIYNKCPMGCHGSYEAVKYWIEQKQKCQMDLHERN